MGVAASVLAVLLTTCKLDKLISKPPSPPARVPVDLVVSAGTPPPATHLGFSVPPTNTQVGATITPAVRVSALDASESRVTTFTGPITLALSANPGGGTLAGGGPVNAVSGVAAFASLSIGKAGNRYTPTATSGQITDATSAPFQITPAPPPPPSPPPPPPPP